jgi:hypothetical protein
LFHFVFVPPAGAALCGGPKPGWFAVFFTTMNKPVRFFARQING